MAVSRFRKAAGVAIIVGAVFASAASADDNEPTKVDSDGSSSGEQGSDGGSATESFVIGDTVALGDWQVVVHSVTNPLLPTDDFTAPDPGNHWVAVDVEVTNASDEAENVSSLLCFEIQDDANRTFDQNIFADGGADAPDGEIEAGGARRGVIVYEVPDDSTGLRIRFQCDLFTGGTAIIELEAAAPTPAEEPVAP